MSPWIEKVVPDLNAERSCKISGHHRRVRYSAKVGNDHDVPKATSCRIHEPGKMLAPRVRHGEYGGIRTAFTGQSRRIGLCSPVGHALEHASDRGHAVVKDGDRPES
jgi:hypothetical protein